VNIALRIAPMALVLLCTAHAFALPRFAARTGNECIQCHVNPSGGGVRNSYGRNVFERVFLPLQPVVPADELSLDLTEEDLRALEASLSAEEEQPKVSFTGDVTDWLALGADFRAAYFWIRPDKGLTPGSDPDITSTFFVMEAYMYMAATLHEHVQFALQIGVYSGFEAWGLFRLKEEGSDYNLLFKAGHFMPAFGIRDAEHQLFTREFIGLGNADRDTGVELTGYAGPLTVQLSLLNGTYTGLTLDTTGTERRTFEKAIVGRAGLRGDFGWLRGQVGGSFYFSENNDQPNPLFTGAIPTEYGSDLGQGVNELRAGAFLMANAGRFTYLADLVYVRDNFYGESVPTFSGYASYQELSFLPLQGLDVVTMLEFMDPNVSLANNTSVRAGLAVEFFPWPFTEFRAMVRRMWSDASPTGGTWDAVLFAHLFL
jgi:hypothetical protein